MLQEYLYNIYIYKHLKNVPVWPLIVGAVLLQFPKYISEFPLKGMSRTCHNNIEAILPQQSVDKREHSSHTYCTNILAILQSHQKIQHKNIILKIIFLSC